MLIKTAVVAGLISSLASGVHARCAPVEDVAKQNQLLEQVRPNVEFKSTASRSIVRFLEKAGPYADYTRPAGGYDHSLNDELKYYDASFSDCAGRYHVKFSPKARKHGGTNTFVFNKQTAWLIAIESEESRFRYHNLKEYRQFRRR